MSCAAATSLSEIAWRIWVSQKSNQIKSYEEFPWLLNTSLTYITVYWVLSQLLLLPRLWIVNIFHCLKLCAIDLKTRLERLRREVSSPTEIKNTLHRFQQLESLIADYNQIFGLYNVVDFLSLTIAITVTLFQIIDYLLKFNIAPAMVYLAPLGLNVVVLFQMFDEANSIELEAGRCVSILRDIPSQSIIEADELDQVSMHVNKFLLKPLRITPGAFFHVNRKTLASIASVITTYLVVLIQFYNADPA
ncbi:unnamed protein product [Orchesella dallaii]|uniref:Gustatory receptor n=1 Tax=Orchesella dallaii TaxID=48710 RepID=A0ABP1R7D4_9HEXA